MCWAPLASHHPSADGECVSFLACDGRRPTCAVGVICSLAHAALGETGDQTIPEVCLRVTCGNFLACRPGALFGALAVHYSA